MWFGNWMFFTNMTEIIIKAKPSDAKKIIRLFNQTKYLADEHVGNSAYYDLSDVREYMKRAETYLYKIDKKVVGFVMIFFNGQYFTKFLAVDAKYHRRGIGQKLLVLAEQRAKKRGVKYAESLTMSSNKKIAGLLKKNGYIRGATNYFWYKKL